MFVGDGNGDDNALRSVSELGAWGDVTLNLIVASGEARPVAIAEITASAAYR